MKNLGWIAMVKLFLKKIAFTLEMINWEHSIFALPFALTGAMLAARGWPSMRTFLLVVACMVSARSAAMAFNRWVDASLDERNPRTRRRAIPAGQLSGTFVAGFSALASFLFVLFASLLNRLTGLLALPVLSVLLGYSLTKRITRYSHLVLGLALGLSPAMAWIAVRGSLDYRILILTGAVVFWVAGFDVLYACQDESHDREVGLYSIPAAIGRRAAFRVARMMHLATILLLAAALHTFLLGFIAWIGLATVCLLMLCEHILVSPSDLSRLNAAFFTMNGVISAVFFLSVATDLLWRGRTH